MGKAMIMDVQRYSIHDGPGIRTTVFFKGCHMACRWCHNPESQYTKPEVIFYQEQCIGCLCCLSFCQREAHKIEKGKHTIDLTICKTCTEKEKCTQVCPTEALRLCGQEIEAEELLKKVMVDRDFYGEEGGVTCSGGEPLLQEAFLQEFLPMCKEQGISTCLDTTLNVEWKKIDKLLPFIDLFLVDIKFMDKILHTKYTGMDGECLKQNLYHLSKLDKPVIVRMPLVFGVSDTGEEIEARRHFLTELSNVQRVDCFAVTNHAAAKYRALQRTYEYFNQGMDLDVLVEKINKKLTGEKA